jgi:hypothetical protein
MLVECLDEAFLLEDLGDRALGPGCGHQDLAVARTTAVADAREHVRNGI